MYSVELFNQFYYSDELDKLIKKVHEVVEKELKPHIIKKIDIIHNDNSYTKSACHITYKLEANYKSEYHISINKHLTVIEEI